VKQEAAVFDLDGVLADDRHRRDKINWGVENPDRRYQDYHAASSTDPFINSNLVYAQLQQKRKIFFVTSRPDYCHQQTVDWLYRHMPELAPFNLMMRPADDHRHSPELKLEIIRALDVGCNIRVVYEDRLDVIEALIAYGFPCEHITTCGEPVGETVHQKINPVADILENMAATFRERSAVYGDNLLMVEPIMKIMFPAGVPEFNTQMHLLELLLMKLTRYAVSGLTHTDSIHDIGVYAAMLEHHTPKPKEKK